MERAREECKSVCGMWRDGRGGPQPPDHLFIVSSAMSNPVMSTNKPQIDFSLALYAE